jgi:hypothetical protein
MNMNESKKVTVLTNIYNEEYMLPCWLEYHKNIFDHGIVIDWDSTDRSCEIIKRICPRWEIRRTNNLVNGIPHWETIAADKEIMEIEKTVSGYKIFLNVTEWLITNKPIKQILDFNSKNKCYPLHVLTPIRAIENYTPPDAKHFIACFRGKLIPVIQKRFFRYIFNRSCGEYKVGRHFTNVPTDLDSIDWKNYKPLHNGMYIVWCGFFPYTNEMWNRKLSVKNYMNKDFELSRGTCFQHFWEIEEMKQDYYNLCLHLPLNSIEMEKSIDYCISIIP